MKKIKVITPGKLMLFGEHAVVYGYSCIVTTVSRYLTVTVSENRGMEDKIFTTELSGVGYIQKVVNSVRMKHQKTEKLSVTVDSQLTGFGLGSSAALTVGLVKALSEFWKIKPADNNIFNTSLSIVRENFPLASGFDLAVCLYGRTILFDGKTKKVTKIQTQNLPIIAVFTGLKVLTADLVNQVKKLKERNPLLAESIFKDIIQIVKNGKIALEKGDWSDLGTLMNRNQQDLVKLGVSTEKIDMIIERSLKKGAYGAKLSGAGGGDCLLVLTSEAKKEAVSQEIIKCGGEILDLKFGVEGTRVC